MKNTGIVSMFILFLLLLFTNCENSNKKSSNDEADLPAQADYLKKGQEIAMNAQAILAKNLMSAIQAGGSAGALSFCNERALPLTDSAAVVLDAKIKRVSDKNRNLANAVNKSELEYIHEAKQAIIENVDAKPKLQEINNAMVGYYPIMTNVLCLQCHGDPEKDINEKTFRLIKERYPKDKAVSYLANELRGIWVITMTK